MPACCLHIAAAIAVDMAIAITHYFIPLESPATDIPQQQLSQREHASVSSCDRNQPTAAPAFFAFWLFFSLLLLLYAAEPALVYYYRVCVIYHKNYAVTLH